jgi:hypothetical protein
MKPTPIQAPSEHLLLTSVPQGLLLLTSDATDLQGCADAMQGCCCQTARVKAGTSCHESLGWGTDHLHTAAQHGTTICSSAQHSRTRHGITYHLGALGDRR